MQQSNKTEDQSFNRELDLGSMTLYDNNAICYSNDENVLDVITQHTIENIKFIYFKAVQTKKQQTFLRESLPQQEQIHDFEQSDLYLQLPQPSILFPRSRRVPQEKKLTKWQKFAKEKGIKKHKKDAMHYDSNSKQMVRRWGAKSKQNKIDVAIMQEKQDGVNPFDTVRDQKKLRKQKQKLKQFKNKQT